MLQLQYLNRKLNKRHVGRILDIYKIKYSGMKMEIESKVNEMINLFIKDIYGFLENMEETANNKKKLNNYEKMKAELESIKNQLKIKTYNEHKTKNELDLLAQENSLLKVKIKSLNQKLSYFNSTNISRSISPLKKNTIKNKRCVSPNSNFKTTYNKSEILKKYKKKISSSCKNKASYRNNDSLKDSKIDNSSSIICRTEKSMDNIDRSNTELCSKILRSSKYNNNKKKPINLSKFVNRKNNKNIINRNNLNILNTSSNIRNESKFFLSSSPPGPIITKISNMINNKKEKSSSSKSYNSNHKENIDRNKYSPDNSFDLLPCINPRFEDIEKDVNNIFDEELRELEQDEENIIKLLEQINNGNFNQ